MAIVLQSIGERGLLSDERIGFKVSSPSNTKNYLVFSTLKTGVGFYNRSENVFWFPPQEVTSKDQIVLYTKSGQDSIKQNSDGSKTYFYYWGLDEAIFKSDKSIVVLAQVNTWTLSLPNPVIV